MHLTLSYFSPKLLYSSADDAAHLLCAIQLLFVVAALLMIWSCGCLLSYLTSPASFAPDASLYPKSLCHSLSAVGPPCLRTGQPARPNDDKKSERGEEGREEEKEKG